MLREIHVMGFERAQPIILRASAAHDLNQTLHSESCGGNLVILSDRVEDEGLCKSLKFGRENDPLSFVYKVGAEIQEGEHLLDCGSM